VQPLRFKGAGGDIVHPALEEGDGDLREERLYVPLESIDDLLLEVLLGRGNGDRPGAVCLCRHGGRKKICQGLAGAGLALQDGHIVPRDHLGYVGREVELLRPRGHAGAGGVDAPLVVLLHGLFQCLC